LSINTNTSIIR